MNFGRMSRLAHSVKSFALPAAAVITLIVAFQNCSEPVPYDAEKSAAAAAAKVEFAYDAAIDQVTYMSCATAEPGGYDSGVYFSFRIGAYGSGGLKLSDSFRVANGKKPVEKQSSLLSESPANTLTSMQFSIRQVGNYQSMQTSSGTAVRGQDYVNVLEPLGTYDISDLLVGLDPAARVKYMRNGKVFGSRMEGSLYYTKNPTLAASIRQALKNEAVLAQTYSHTVAGASTDTFARSPHDVTAGSTANPNTQVFGRGYKLDFSQPTIGAVASNAAFPTVILRGITESNLAAPTDRTGLSTWACPETLRFRIVRPADARAALVPCVVAADPAVPTAELAMVRNQLRVEDWYVDMVNRCIVPKKSPTTCYGAATSVQYNITLACQEGIGAACVSFASVCYRQ